MQRLTQSVSYTHLDVYKRQISKITVSIFEDGISDRMEPDKHYEFRTDRPLDRDYYAEYQRYMANLRQKNSPATDQSTQDRKELE